MEGGVERSVDRDEIKHRKREEASVRDSVYKSLSDKNKIAMLDKNGYTAKRQRARILGTGDNNKTDKQEV